jgi:hypothetical protein
MDEKTKRQPSYECTRDLYVTNAKCIAALRYKAGLGTMSDETLKKLDTVYCDTNRAKAGHTSQVHSRFTFMERTEGGAGVQLPTAVSAAATRPTPYTGA